MAVSALTVLLSNCLEESQFVSQPAGRRRLVLEGPGGATLALSDSEEDAARGCSVRAGGLRCGSGRHGSERRPTRLAAALPCVALAAARPAFTHSVPPGQPTTTSHRHPPLLATSPRSRLSRACLQTRWHPRWMQSTRRTWRRWRRPQTRSSAAASRCCRAWRRLRAWWATAAVAAARLCGRRCPLLLERLRWCFPVASCPVRLWATPVLAAAAFPQVRVLQCVSSSVELLGDRLRPHLATICSALPQVWGRATPEAWGRACWLTLASRLVAARWSVRAPRQAV